MENYEKLTLMREMLVQKYTKRLMELCGPQLQARRSTGEKIPSEIHIVNNKIITACIPLHKLIGSSLSPDLMEQLDSLLKKWLGDRNLETIMTELNSEVLTYARVLSSRTIDDVEKNVTEQRAALQQLMDWEEHKRYGNP